MLTPAASTPSAAPAGTVLTSTGAAAARGPACSQVISRGRLPSRVAASIIAAARPVDRTMTVGAGSPSSSRAASAEAAVAPPPSTTAPSAVCDARRAQRRHDAVNVGVVPDAPAGPEGHGVDRTDRRREVADLVEQGHDGLLERHGQRHPDPLRPEPVQRPRQRPQRRPRTRRRSSSTSPRLRYAARCSAGDSEWPIGDPSTPADRLGPSPVIAIRCPCRPPGEPRTTG